MLHRCLANSILLNITCLFVLTGCNDAALEKLKQQGELIVLTRNAPTTYYEGRDGPTGPEYDLVMSFATRHGLTVQFKQLESVDAILTAIRAGEGHIAAAGLTQTENRLDDGLIFGPAYQQVQQQVVCRRGNGGLPDEPEELVGLKISVIENSSYQETLQNLKTDYPALQWNTTSDKDTEQLLEDVWRRKIDCTLADSNIVSINRRYFPELLVAFEIGEPQAMAWVLAPNWTGLNRALEDWLEDVEEEGYLEAWQERHYGHVEIFDYVDMRAFLRRIEHRLPKYKPMFETAGRKYRLPWSLLAAQAYQESHWRAHARSPTGVRGIMMLTLTTANALGVESRLDPQQSVMGGARYLRRLLNRLPEEIKPADRNWFALAAYNVGFGHLQDARELAVSLDRNPNRWVEIKEVLPLLAQKQYYKTLKHGYARGREPVRYVQRIRNYHQVLEKHFRKRK